MIDDVSVSQEQHSAVRIARRVVTRAIVTFDADRVETAGRVGDPATEIPSAAAAETPRFLVIGGRRRSPVGRAVFGSTPLEVLPRADWPVVTTMGT